MIVFVLTISENNQVHDPEVYFDYDRANRRFIELIDEYKLTTVHHTAYNDFMEVTLWTVPTDHEPTPL